MYKIKKSYVPLKNTNLYYLNKKKRKKRYVLYFKINEKKLWNLIDNIVNYKNNIFYSNIVIFQITMDENNNIIYNIISKSKNLVKRGYEYCKLFI